MVIALAALAACRFGGPSGDPSAYVTYPSDAESPDAHDLGASGGGTGSSGDDATVGAASDATVGATGDAAFADDMTLGDDTSSGDDASGGCSTTVAVCNPVHNTGCNPLQQCDVDTTQKTTRSGICVFNSGSEGSSSCSTSIFTESCPPQSTCVNGGCRALCFCQADCPAPLCCSDTSGPAGFTLCQACP